MRTDGLLRHARAALLPMIVAFLATALVLVLLGSGKMKLVGAIIGGSLVLGAALLSGNPRLFCLWGFMLTLPFDLSKRFGEVIKKMGGETAFRVEMSDPFILGLLLFISADIWRGTRQHVRIPKLLLLWFFVAAMGLIPIIVGPYHLTAMHEVARMMKLTVAFLVILNELNRRGRIVHCAAALMTGMSIQAIVGLIQFATKKRLGLDMFGETAAETVEQLATSSVQGERVFRISAFLVHPNIFGIFLAVLLPMAIAGAMLIPGKKYKALCIVSGCLSLPALIGTLSRSGWVSFSVSFTIVVVLLLIHHKTRQRALVTVALALIGMSLVFSVYSGPILRRIVSSQAGAMRGRAEFNRDAKRMFMAKPVLGWGLNTYVFNVPPFTKYGPREAINIYQGWIPAVHNIYYLWLAELGVVGFLANMLLIGWVFKIAFGNVKVRDPVLFAINAACLAGLAAFMVDGFFSFSLRMNAIARLFWVLTALIIAIRYLRVDETRTAAAMVPASRPRLVVLNGSPVAPEPVVS